MSEGSDDVAVFVSEFMKAFRNNKTLYTAFAKIIAGIHEDFIYNYCFDYAAQVKIPDPAAFASSIENAMRSVAHILKPVMYAESGAGTYARFLKDYGVLTPENAVEHSRKFTKAYIDKTSSLDETSTGKEYYHALADGAMEWLSSINMMSPVKLQVLITSFLQDLNKLKSISV